MSAVTIRLSYPPKELSPNGSRLHWAAKARAVAAYKHEARIEALRAWAAVNRAHGPGPMLCAPVVATVEVIYKVERGRDGDNAIAMLKSAFDGFVSAGVLSSDTADKLTIMPPTFVKGERAAVAITLTEAS